MSTSYDTVYSNAMIANTGVVLSEERITAVALGSPRDDYERIKYNVQRGADFPLDEIEVTMRHMCANRMTRGASSCKIDGVHSEYLESGLALLDHAPNFKFPCCGLKRHRQTAILCCVRKCG